MYIAKLDRPWLDSPFLFQGFYIENGSDIQLVQQVCRYVYIDVSKGTHKDLLPNKDSNFPDNSIANIAYKNTEKFEVEIAVAKEIRHTAKNCIDDVFKSITRGKSINVPQVKSVVSNLVDNIVRNPNALICLNQLKNKDEYTAQHSLNVCILTVTFCRHLGMPERLLNMIGLGALLHDVGKMNTPLEILNKPDKLTDEEFRIMKTHPEHGKRILEEAGETLENVIDIAFSHHERLAGHGYPLGKAEKHISTWSKIVAIVDVFDAITSDRCYHNGMSPTHALTKMYEWRTRDFDPDLLERFTECIGIYPVGTLVELTSGEVGLVISVNTEFRLKPKVLLILDKNKISYFPPRIVDLSIQQPDTNNCNYFVKTTLDPKSYNIDIKDYVNNTQPGKQIVTEN